MIFLSLFGSFLNHTLLSLTFSSLFVIYFAIPFSNLLILLYSSFSIQSSLIFMKFGFLLNMVEGLSQTIGIGILFVVLQFKEFLYSIYTYSSSFLGSILYFTTGLHGIHVLIGLLLLLFSFYSLWCFYTFPNTSRSIYFPYTISAFTPPLYFPIRLFCLHVHYISHTISRFAMLYIFHTLSKRSHSLLFSLLLYFPRNYTRFAFPLISCDALSHSKLCFLFASAFRFYTLRYICHATIRSPVSEAPIA